MGSQNRGNKRNPSPWVATRCGRRGSTVRVETEKGAHTAGWDPVGRRLYVFCPASSGAAVYEERG